MSSISSLGSSQYTYSSPLQQLEAELQSEVSAGTVSSSDQSALSSALTSIDSSLSAGQSSSGPQAAGSTGDNGPGDIKSKINSLIQAQVASGALTSNQATELQNLLVTPSVMAPAGSGGTRRARWPTRIWRTSSRPAPVRRHRVVLERLQARRSINCSTVLLQRTLRRRTIRRPTAPALNNILQNFLKQLQDAQSLSYGANGATTAASSLGSTLLNYQA